MHAVSVVMFAAFTALPEAGERPITGQTVRGEGGLRSRKLRKGRRLCVDSWGWRRNGGPPADPPVHSI
jgi:hypothetical protein